MDDARRSVLELCHSMVEGFVFGSQTFDFVKDTAQGGANFFLQFGGSCALLPSQLFDEFDGTGKILKKEVVTCSFRGFRGGGGVRGVIFLEKTPGNPSRALLKSFVADRCHGSGFALRGS